MEQIQYNPNYIQEDFRPARAADRNVGLSENQAASARSSQAIIAQMQRDANTMARNAERNTQGIAKLAKFSKTLTEKVEEDVYRRADEDFAEGILQAQANPSLLLYEEGDSAKPVLDAAGKALAENPNNADVVVPLVRGSRFHRMGFEQGTVQNLLTTSYTPFIEAFVRDRNPQNPQELAVAIAEGKAAFWSKAPIQRASLSNKFLIDKVFPLVNKMDYSISSQFTKHITSEQSFATQNEAAAAFSANGDIATYLGTVAATTNANGDILGYRGAWKNFATILEQGIVSGTYTEADITELRNQKIPDDPKGRTYGELHGVHFDRAQKQAANARRAAYRDDQLDRSIRFDTQQQQLLDAFAGADADGYTSEQIEDAADRLEAEFPGLQATKLRNMISGSVDAKAREKQEEQIQDLQAMGLLTPDRLMEFDRKLWSKYMGAAVQQQQAFTKNGNYKQQLDVISDAVKTGPKRAGDPTATAITATPDGRMGPSVGMMEMMMHQYFMKKVQEYSIAGNADPAGAALRDTLTHFNETAKVSSGGYVGMMPSSSQVQNDRMRTDARIADINDAMKNPNFLAPDNKPNLFTKPQLEAMGNGFGTPGWKPSAEINYIAQMQGVDPLTVINKLRAQQGVPELASTPANDVVANELTPAQRAALANIGTPQVSTRTMGALGWKPELVPNGYGPMVEKAAASSGLPPAQIAAMAEIESAWNPNANSGTSIGLMQIHPPSHPEFAASGQLRDPQASLDYGAKFFASLVKRYNGDLKAAAMAYNAGPAAYDAYVRGERYYDAKEREMINHGNKYMKALYKYGGGQQTLNDSSNVRSSSFDNPNFRPTGDAKQRTISVGRHLQSLGYGGIWQHPDFEYDKGYTGSGSERVMRRSYNSSHNHQEALDFGLQANGEAKLDKLYDYLTANQERFGIKTILWRVKGHYDHLHVAFDHEKTY